MDKTIYRYLEKRGVHCTEPFIEDIPFSERAPDFFGWFHHSVLNLDTDEYSKKFWNEATRRGRTIGPVPYTLDTYLRSRRLAYRADMIEFFAYALLMGGSFFLWVIRKQIDKHIRRLRRPSYYEVELSRRKRLAADRRRLKSRSTLNPCPSSKEVLQGFKDAKKSPEAMIRFGSLLEDLECFVDNSAIFDDNGNIVGRRGGIHQYLRENIPELASRYKTVMKYKSLSKRFRQAMGVADPVPASSLLSRNIADKAEENQMRGVISECAGINETCRDFVSEQDIEMAQTMREMGKGVIGIDRKNEDEGCVDEGNAQTGNESSKNKVIGEMETGHAKTIAERTADGDEGVAGSTMPSGFDDAMMPFVRNAYGGKDMASSGSTRLQKRAFELLSGCENTYVSVMARVSLLVNPEYAPRMEYEARLLTEKIAEGPQFGTGSG